MEDLDHRAELNSARSQTDQLFSSIDPSALFDRPIPERHRIIFYLGHLEAFDWNQLKAAGYGDTSPEPAFDRLFEFGIDPPRGELPSDTASDWPSVEAVRRYNAEIRGLVDQELKNVPPAIVHMLIEHRHMHAETFAYMMHNLPHQKKLGPSIDAIPAAKPFPRTMLEIPAGSAVLGRNPGDGFGWDNEFSAFTVEVPAFAIDKYKVTNGDYLEYVRLGGPAPHYWIQSGDDWLLRTMFEDVPLPLDWPVYVTQRQASEYAAWRGAVLPTEAQFHRAAFGTPTGGERLLPWHTNGFPNGADHGNFDYRSWNPSTVYGTPAGDSGFGVSQLIGNGWEWTDTIFAPFEGFQPHPTYPGYSANFFDNQHYVMKGASPRTAKKLVRRSLRNWFRPDYPYVYATFRLVRQ